MENTLLHKNDGILLAAIEVINIEGDMNYVKRFGYKRCSFGGLCKYR